MSIPDDTQTTHSTECWKWHLECAGREVERLRGELAREHKQSELAWSKVDEWGAEALEAHLKNARLGAVISRLRRPRRARAHSLPACWRHPGSTSTDGD